jgi:hypothetical protein
MAMERVELICKTCKNKTYMNVDTEAINPKKIRLESCLQCPLDVRREKFKSIANHGMKQKKVSVKEIPGMEVTAEIRPIQSKRYK